MRNNLKKLTEQGFTLVELMIVIVILGVLITIAIPSYSEMTANQRLVSTSTNLINALSTARGEAVKQKRHVTVCASSDGSTCATDLTEWNNGWIVFANTDSANLQRNTTEEVESLRQVYEKPNGISNITLSNDSGAAAALIAYRPSGVIGNIASNQVRLFTICDKRGASKANAVWVSRSGRAKTTKVGFTSAALTCP